MALPGTTASLSRGTPVFQVGGRTYAMVVDDHHGADCAGIWLKAEPGLQARLVADDPRRYFVPPYLGARGWVGLRVSGRPSWKLIEELLVAAHAATMPRGRRGPRVEEPRSSTRTRGSRSGRSKS